MSEQNRLVIDKEKVKRAAQAGIPLTITTYMLTHEMEVYITEMLTLFLKYIGQTHMTDYLVYCVSELATNAKKANTKRIYFRQKNLDIFDPEDYEKGMSNFKKETFGNVDPYLQKQRDEGLYIKVSFLARNGKIRVEVKNNCKLTVFEFKRIHDKLCRAQQYNTMQDAMNTIVDETEGSGLGLIIMILMLKKIGLTEDDYSVLVDDNETNVRVEIPFSNKTKENFDAISKKLVSLINELPSFPENIVNINRLIDNPDSEITDVANQISGDVALTADLLKLVNSAAFRPANLCQNVTDAVKLIGLQGVKQLLFSLGTMKLLGENTNEKKKLWKHSNEVAFYSFYLAKNYFTSDKAIVADAYVNGLLHDIGKIVFASANTGIMDQLVTISAARGIPFQIIEQMVEGTNHEFIGAKIAEKWGFPEKLISTIRYHHEPELAPEENRKLVYLVSFANLLTYYKAEEIEFYQIPADILQLFRINSEEDLKALVDRLSTAYEKNNARR